MEGGRLVDMAAVACLLVLAARRVLWVGGCDAGVSDSCQYLNEKDAHPSWYKVVETRKAVGQSVRVRQPLVSGIIIACLRRTLLVHAKVFAQNRAGKHPAQATNSCLSPGLRLCLVAAAARAAKRCVRLLRRRCMNLHQPPPSLPSMESPSRAYSAKNPKKKLEQFLRKKRSCTQPVYAPAKSPQSSFTTRQEVTC